MPDVAQLGIVVELKDGQLVARKLDDITNAADRTEKQAKSLTATIKGLAATFGVGIIARAELQNIIEAQDAMAQLEARVKSTGGAAGLTVKQLDDLSGALQDVTTYSDEAVKSAETMLLTFSKVKGDTFSRATQDILDLAQAMGGDLQGAAVQVGKALQDPEQGMLALRRSGVSFSDSQQQVIKDLFNTGKEAEAQALILQELEKEFGGAAAAARNTLGGALKGLVNDFGNLFEVTTQGTSLIVGFINRIDEGIKHLGDYRVAIETVTISLGLAGLTGVILKLLPVMKEMLFISGITGAFQAASVAGTGLTGVLIGVAGGLKAMIAPALGAISWATGFGPALAAASIAGTGFTGVLVGMVPALTALAAAALPIVALGAAIAAVVSGIKTYREAAANQRAEDESITQSSKELAAVYKARHEKEAAARAASAEKARQEAEAIKKATAERQIEIDRMNALNTAYGQGDVALAKINAHYDRLAQDAKDAVDHHGRELDALKRLNAERERAAIRAAELSSGDVIARVNQQELAAAMPQLEAGFKSLGAAITPVNQLLYDYGEAHKALREATPAIKKSIADVAKTNEELTRKWTEEDGKRAESTIKYAHDMETIWRDGIGKIVTDGTKSFHDFFEDVLQMFSALMKRMEAEGKASGGLYKLLGIGSAAITGGVAGYSVGQSTGSAAAGMGSGVLTGVMAGSAFGAPGMIIGGLAGAVGGLMGAAKAHSEAAKQLREAANAIRDKLASYVLKASGDNLQSQLFADTQEYKSLLKELSDVYDKGGMSMRDFTTQVADLNAAHEALAETLKHEAEMTRARDELGLRAQILDAQGDTKGAADLRRMMEMWEAINGGKSPEYIALLEKLQDIQRANEAEAKAQQDAADAQQKAADEAAKQKELLTQLRDATQAMADDINRQVEAQQQTIQATQRIVDQLKQYRDSLSLNPSLSILSPGAQLAQARSSYQALLAKAMQGDQTAAGGLPDAANTFLQLSRNYNASGAGYVADFRSVQAGLGAVQDQFGAQLSTEEKMLAELQKQSAYFQKQIEVLNQQLGVSKQSAQMQYVTTLLANTKSVTDANGNVISGVNVAADAIRKLFPGLAVMVDQRSGTGYLGNADFRSPIEYYSWAYRNEEDKSNVPADIRAMLHDAGIPGYANGGAFGGGLMRVGEVGQELVATGPARVHTARDLNAPTVAEIRALREEVADMAAALRAGFTQQIETTAQVGETVKTSARDTSRAITQTVGGKA